MNEVKERGEDSEKKGKRERTIEVASCHFDFHYLSTDHRTMKAYSSILCTIGTGDDRSAGVTLPLKVCSHLFNITVSRFI